MFPFTLRSKRAFNIEIGGGARGGFTRGKHMRARTPETSNECKRNAGKQEEWLATAPWGRHEVVKYCFHQPVKCSVFLEGMTENQKMRLNLSGGYPARGPGGYPGGLSGTWSRRLYRWLPRLRMCSTQPGPGRPAQNDPEWRPPISSPYSPPSLNSLQARPTAK